MSESDLFPFNQTIKAFFAAVSNRFIASTECLDIENQRLNFQGAQYLSTAIKEYYGWKEQEPSVALACKIFLRSDFFMALDLLERLANTTHFFSAILENTKFVSALSLLVKRSFFSPPETFDYLTPLYQIPHPDRKAYLLLSLKQEGLLSPKWRALALYALQNRSAVSAVSALKLLNSSGRLNWLFDLNLCEKLLAQNTPLNIAKVIAALDVESLSFFDQNKDLVAEFFNNFKDIAGLNEAFVQLKQSGLFTAKNIKQLLHHKHPKSFAGALIALSSEPALEGQQELVLYCCARNCEPDKLIARLIRLNATLTAKEFQRYASFFSAAHGALYAEQYWFFNQLGCCNLEGQSARVIDALKKHKKLSLLERIQQGIQSASFQNWDAKPRRDFFETLLYKPEHMLLEDALWQLIPDSFFPSLTQLQDMIVITEREDLSLEAKRLNLTHCVLAALLTYRPQRRLRPILPVAPNIFNDQQSTHQQTVHDCSELSILMLLAVFAGNAPIEAKNSRNALRNLISTCQSTDITDKKAAALRYLDQNESSRASLDFNHEKKSRLLSFFLRVEARIDVPNKANLKAKIEQLPEALNLNLAQILRLYFLATKDEAGAAESWINALYEIQRGYNLSDTGTDDACEDNPICFAGTLNKLCESLSGLSPYIPFIYVSPQTLIAKIKILFFDKIKEKAERLPLSELSGFLEKLRSTNAGDEYQRILEEPSTQSYLESKIKDEYLNLVDASMLNQVLSEMAGWIPDLPALAKPESPAIGAWSSEIYRELELLEIKAAQISPSAASGGLFAATQPGADAKKRRKEAVPESISKKPCY